MKARRRWLALPESWSPALRWLNISLRSLHLIGVAGLAGGYLFDLPEAQWAVYRHVTLASGGLLAGVYLWSDRTWLCKLKGQAIALKLALLGLAVIEPHWRAALFVLVIVLSAVFAHAPDRVRSWAWGQPVRRCR